MMSSSPDYMRDWRRKNRDKVRAYQRVYHAKHRGYAAAQVQAWRDSNVPRELVRLAKDRARQQGVPFEITEEDILVPEVCPALGVPLIRGRNSGIDNSPSLDKLRPAGGYVVGNVAVISHRANRIKSDATAAELRAIADWMDSQERE